MSWKYFEFDDFKCKCGCGENKMQPYFIDILDEMRSFIGRPFIINSGYRCDKYDATFGGKGNHTTGLAADINTPDSAMRFALFYHGVLADINRFGFAPTYTHLDAIHAGRPQEVSWLYF